MILNTRNNKLTTLEVTVKNTCLKNSYKTSINQSTILDKIFGTKERNTVKLDKTSNMLYLILHVFLTAIVNI